MTKQLKAVKFNVVHHNDGAFMPLVEALTTLPLKAAELAIDEVSALQALLTSTPESKSLRECFERAFAQLMLAQDKHDRRKAAAGMLAVTMAVFRQEDCRLVAVSEEMAKRVQKLGDHLRLIDELEDMESRLRSSGNVQAADAQLAIIKQMKTAFPTV